MLPGSYSQAYQDFVKKLLLLRSTIDISKLDLVASKRNFKSIQEFFQKSITHLSDEGLDPAIASRWRSLQTEICRSFKLLEVEMMFVLSSKQSTTQQQRLKSINDRLSQLIEYCELIRKS